MSQQSKSHSQEKAEEVTVATVEPKKETKAEKAEHVIDAAKVELDAVKAERDVLVARNTALEAFLTDSLKSASWNSTTAVELLKKA